MNRGPRSALLALGSLLALAMSVAVADNYKIRFYTIDGGGEMFTSGGVYRLSGTIGQPDAGPMTGGVYKLRGGFWGRACIEDCDCDDENVCTLDGCGDTRCSNEPNRYGDVDGNGTVSIFDLFCVLNGFGGDFSRCAFCNVDIHGVCLDPEEPPCCPDGVIDIFDLFAVLNAYRGVDPCCGGMP